LDENFMVHLADTARAPSALLTLIEGRAVLEFATLLASYPILRRLPRGDGHTVLVLPGLGASDRSTGPLRAFLKDRGYDARGWSMGRNVGPREGQRDALADLLKRLHGNSNRKVSLIGWSLGGIYAREIAKRLPGSVRLVITLGSPFANPAATQVRRIYEAIRGQPLSGAPDFKRLRAAPPVPATAIFSKSDGVVAWQSCLEPDGAQTENIEIEGSHIGLGVNPAALYVIADRLAQKEGAWQPFDRRGVRRFVFKPAQKSTA
jgi:pimeloyl-ACP methyl ester carboxylesterase